MRTRAERRNLRERAGQVERNGVGRTSDHPRQTTGRKHGREERCSRKNLNLKRDRFQCSYSRCYGLEFHHPIMNTLWDHGYQTKRRIKIINKCHHENGKSNFIFIKIQSFLFLHVSFYNVCSYDCLLLLLSQLFFCLCIAGRK